MSTATSADGAFIAAKRSECGAVYAATADLAALDEAMNRDGISHRYLPLWIEPAEVAQTRDAIEQDKTRSAEQHFKRQRELDDDAGNSIRSERMKKAFAVPRRNRRCARSTASGLGSSSKPWATRPVSSRPVSRLPVSASFIKACRSLPRPAQRSLGVHVPRNARARLRHGALQEPPLETALVTTRIKMRNRVKGEYQDVCYVTGYINDAEFSGHTRRIRRALRGIWTKTRSIQANEHFTSRWIVP